MFSLSYSCTTSKFKELKPSPHSVSNGIRKWLLFYSNTLRVQGPKGMRLNVQTDLEGEMHH